MTYSISMQSIGNIRRAESFLVIYNVDILYTSQSMELHKTGIVYVCKSKISG